MAFDFPNTPSTGTRVTGAGGVVYVWDGVKWTSNVGSVTVQSMGDEGRNLVVNGTMLLASRGGGPWTTSGSYTLDHYWMGFTGGSMSVSGVSTTDADRAAIGDEYPITYLQTVFTGGGGAAAFAMLSLGIEIVRRISSKTVTLSFWARANSGTPKIGIQYQQVFGSGGSPSPITTPAGTAVTISTTWTRYTVTTAIPSGAGKVYGTSGDDLTSLNFWLSSGATNNTQAGGIGVQSGTISLWGVQLEVGNVATPLQKMDYDAETRRCQYYFCSGRMYHGQYGIAGNTIYVYARFPANMRIAPQLVIGGNRSSNLTAVSIAGDNIGIIAQGVVTTTGGYGMDFDWTANAEF